MRRIYRQLSDETKQKISNSMKVFHHKNTIENKRRSNILRSTTMKRYWAGIPNKEEDDDK